MYDTDDRPLGPIAKDAYEVLLKIIESGEGIPRSDAHARLLEGDFVDGDAEYALDQLLNRGYLYAIDERLFVTDDEDFE